MKNIQPTKQQPYSTKYLENKVQKYIYIYVYIYIYIYIGNHTYVDK